MSSAQAGLQAAASPFCILSRDPFGSDRVARKTLYPVKARAPHSTFAALFAEKLECV
jgi:hypothetical protein